MAEQSPILVTGAAGRVGAVGRTVTELLLKQGKAVRAMVRNEDERAQALRDIGAEVVVGNLLDLDSMHRAIAGCDTMYFGMSVSDAYLAATVNAAAVAKHHGVKAFINMSQMTLSQMSITETTASPQHKLHWLAEQALNWSGLPVVHVRPTVFLDGFFLIFTSDSVRKSNQIRLPFGEGKTSPIAAEDVARVVAALLSNPQPHIGKVYHLTGPQSENMHFYAQEYSKALGRTITAIERITRSATWRSFWTSPVEETKTRIVFIMARPALIASLTVGTTFRSSVGVWKRRTGSFARSTSSRTTSGCGIPVSCSTGKGAC